MSELLRAFDHNAVRRTLRDLIYDVHMEFAIDRSAIPHTYDTKALLAHAERLLRRRDLKGTELHQQLLFRTGVAHCVVGSKRKGREFFERGTRLSDYPPDQALFRYAIGQWVYRRNGGRRDARRILNQAREQSERGRHLRTEIDLALGSIHTGEGDGFAAQQRFERILRRGVLELRPIARLYNVEALLAQKLVDEAWQENERAKGMLRASSDWRLHMLYLANRAHLHLVRGELEEALPVQKRVLDERHRRLHTAVLAREYSNYTMLLRRAGRLDEALESGLDGLRLVELVGPRYQASTYRNLGLLLEQMGKTDASLGAIDVSLEIARRHELRDFEFKSLTAAVQVLGGLGETDQIPSILARLNQLLREHRSLIPREALEEYVGVTASLGGLPGEPAKPREVKRVARPGDRQALNNLVGTRRAPDFEQDLSDEIRDGMGFEDAPATSALARFLLLFAGDHFKSMSYQREFGKSQPRAKYHLQWLVNSRLLERIGTRKASTYILAFHRR